jgi:hypothetical protein
VQVEQGDLAAALTFFAYGISRSIAHRSTLSAGHGL